MWAKTILIVNTCTDKDNFDNKNALEQKPPKTCKDQLKYFDKPRLAHIV